MRGDLMRKKLIISMLAIVLVFTVIGCNKQDTAEYVAKVNGQTIAQTEFNLRVEQAAAMNNVNLADPQFAAYKDMFEMQILDRMIDEVLLENEAKNVRKLEVKKEEVDAELKEIKGQFPSEAEFTSYFKEQLKMSEKDIRATIETQLLVQALFEEVTKDINSTDMDLELYYNDHKDEFYEEEQLRARHILVDTKEEALEIIRQITVEKQDMAQLAVLKSTEPAAKTTQGDLGYFGRGGMVKPFEDATFALKVGELTQEPVETSFGWHVIRLEDKLEAKQYTFAEVKSDLEERFIFGEKNEAFANYMAEVKDKAEIENKLLEKLEAEQEKAAQENKEENKEVNEKDESKK